MTGRVAALVLAAVTAAALAACGGSPGSAHVAARRTPSAAQLAEQRAVVAECKPSEHIYDEVNGSQTVGSFDQGVAIWEADLTATQGLSSGVPKGPERCKRDRG